MICPLRMAGAIRQRQLARRPRAGLLGAAALLPPPSCSPDPPAAAVLSTKLLQRRSRARTYSSMDVAKAQATRVASLPALLSPADISRVHECAASSASSAGKDLSKHDGRWDTLYLHTGGHFQRECPDILAKIVEGMQRAERAEPSMRQLLTSLPVEDVGCRCIEYHEVREGGGLPDPRHHDIGSLLTVDVMLSDPSADFEGGEFHTLECDGMLQPHAFSAAGDALMFVSHKYHCVQPVRSGLRHVLVLEFWVGPERHCAHRCDTPPELPCSHTYRPEKLAATRGLNTVLDALDSGDPAMLALAAAATVCLDPLTVSQMAEVRQSKLESETATIPPPATTKTAATTGDGGGGGGRTRRRREKRELRVLLPPAAGGETAVAAAAAAAKIRRFTVPRDAEISQVLRRLMAAGHLPEQAWRGLRQVTCSQVSASVSDDVGGDDASDGMGPQKIWCGSVSELDLAEGRGGGGGGGGGEGGGGWLYAPCM